MSDCTDVDAAPRPVTGPRIARLARQLEGVADAEARDALTEAFWAEAARTGTPLSRSSATPPATGPSPSCGAATAPPAGSC